MRNGGTIPRALKRGKPCPMQKMGYEDARNSRQFTPLYAFMNEIDQKNYQNGRLICTYIRGAGVIPPVWNPKAIGIPDTIKELARKHSLKDDNPARKVILIGKRMPDDPELKFTSAHLDRRGFPLPVPTYC